MDNLCFISNFEEIKTTRNFVQYPSPDQFGDYKIFIGGNFIFIENSKSVVARFSFSNFSTNVDDELIERSILLIRKRYPYF